eukprot:IDg17844t1
MIGYSNQSKGYKLWNTESGKFIVSRDVTFNELDTPHLDTPRTSLSQDSFDTDMDLAGEEDDLIPSQSQNSSENQETVNSTTSVPNSHPAPESITVRRSARKKQPLESAIVCNDAPKSYAEATSHDNIDFWAPGTKKEEDSIRENNTFTLVQHEPGMHVLPS